MSMLVWLPLTNDLQNQGLSNVQFKTNGAILATNEGKIGQCHYLNGKTISCSNFNLLETATEFSACCWVKFTSFPTAGNNAYCICLNNTSTSNYKFILGVFSTSDSDGTTASFRLNILSGSSISGLKLNKWYHLAICISGTTGYMYINGELKKTVTGLKSTAATNLVIGGRSTNTAGTTFTGVSASAYYNDIRIYNHCLSQKEVKEISKGLIAHYPLRNTYYEDSSGYLNHLKVQGNNLTIGENSIRNRWSICIPDGTNNYLYNSSTFFPYDTATINCWFKTVSGQVGGNNYHIPFASDGGRFEISIEGSTGKMRGGFYVNGTRQCITTSSNNICDGNWHMLTLTYDGSIIRRYLDGEEIANSSTTIAGALTGGKQLLTIGHYGTSSGYGNKNSEMSDVRLYATALSSSDIQNLYKTSAWIDDAQNIFAYHFYESNYSRINKNGIVEANNLTSDQMSKVKIFQDTITSNKFIEI